MANQLDSFGIKMIYPTRQGGREWYCRDSVDEIAQDSRAAGDLEDDIVAGGNNTDGFEVGDNGQVRLHAAADSSLREASNPDLDHSTAKGRGYAFSTKDWDMKGIEVTAQIFCSDHEDQDSRFIMKGPSGSHNSNTVDCSGSAYGVRFFLAPSGDESGCYQWFKEQWHVHYESRGEVKKHGLGSIFNKWVTCKFILYIVKSTSGTEEWVKMEAWLDVTGDGVSFTKIGETVDTGGWGDAATECGAEVDDEILTWDNAHMTLRWDGPIIKFRKYSVREIDPTRSIDGGEPPEPPTTGTIARDWIFKNNIIAFPLDACNVGQDTTDINIFYDVDDNSSASNLHQQRYRVGIVANGSLAYLIGKKPKRVKVKLSRTGTLTSGPVSVVLRKGTDDEVAVTYTYTGGTLDGALVSTSKTDYTFENLTNNYAWQNGDRLMVEYSAHTADVANELNVWRNTDNPVDGSNTCLIKFDSGGVPPVAYSAPDISRDLAWEVSE